MTIRILQGDCREVLRTLPDASVQCCVTSPPYYGLRDYGTAQWEAGDAGCEHSVGGQVQDSKAPGAIQTGVRPGVDASKCRKCGARRIDAQIGLEQSPAEYVEQMVAVFREVRRVLRDDGTLWLNLGDSYNGYYANQYATSLSARNQSARPDIERGAGLRVSGLKPKDLIGIPWRVAFALQADGWWLRSDIIWAKPNPMPESVTDRPTSAHEHVFLLAKSQRYFFDADAIAESADPKYASRYDLPFHVGVKESAGAGRPGNAANTPGMKTFTGKRNARNVWTIATAPFPEAHFATFPPELAERCILAGTKSLDEVLDPFGGAGTVGLVADRLRRNAVLIELNPSYAEMARKRLESDAGMFAEVA